MNPNIDMTYTRSFIDVFFWNAVYDISPKKKAQGIHEEGVLATINIWADFVSTITEYLVQCIFSSTVCGTCKKMECP
jgi:hypothetical protein